MISLCKNCAYKMADCKGNKDIEKVTCEYFTEYTEAEVLNAIKTMGLFRTSYPNDVVAQVVFTILKKHTPRKPYWLYDDEPLCPYCHCVLEEYEEVCGECTQLIDWSDEK